MRTWQVAAMAVSAVVLSQLATAQSIEKMKLTDGELTCAQLYAESTQMDTFIGLGGSSAAANPQPVAPQQFQNSTQAIMQANNLGRQDLVMTQQLMLQSRDPRVRAAASDPQSVAQYAAMLSNPQLAVAAQRAAAAGVNPAFIQSQVNAVAIAQGYQYQANQAAQQNNRPQQQAQAPAMAGLADQARARKEHLTNLFLQQGCKLSDLKR